MPMYRFAVLITDEKNRGACWVIVDSVLSDLGLWLEKQLKPWITVNRRLKKHGRGTYIVFTRGHCYAVVDGIIYDGVKLKYRSRVRGICRVFTA